MIVERLTQMRGCTASLEKKNMGEQGRNHQIKNIFIDTYVCVSLQNDRQALKLIK